MIEVAVYNSHQHEQFASSTGRFVLRQVAATEIWAYDELDESVENANELRFHVSSTGVEIDASRTRAHILNAAGEAISGNKHLPLPCLLQIGTTWIEIAQCSELQNLVPLLPTELIDFDDDRSTGKDQTDGPSSETITRWLTETSQLHQAAAASPQFFADAARFAVETVGLDAAWVLVSADESNHDNRPNQGEWRIAGSKITSPAAGIRFENSVLEKICQQSVAWYQPALQLLEESSCSPTSHQAIVAAPVVDNNGQMVAAIYGVRNTTGNNRRRGIRPLEARLVQLLAESVGVGIARLEQEIEATRTQVLLEQAFSPTVAKYIQHHPESLLGQQREITLLFADLHDYTSIAETMNPADCYALLGDVMETLTDVVMQNGGIVVDYYGDGLLAIWNAPLDQTNHADLACTAALQMFDDLPAATGNWEALLDRPLELGIGIHTGPTQVGNAGTRSRIKYGPRGNTVNVASRVQAASKQLHLPLIVTRATQEKLTNKFFSLRTCTAKLPGLAQPVELYTAYLAAKADRVKNRLDQYARALQLFEADELAAAEQLLDQLVTLGQVTPAKFLAHYTAAKKQGKFNRRTADKQTIAPIAVIEILSK